jgi:citrate lyase gamma subunit
MSTEPLHYLTASLDIQNSTSRTDGTKIVMRRVIADAVEQAFADIGVSAADRQVEDRGDGAILLVAASVPKRRFVGRWVVSFHRALLAHNRIDPEPFQVRIGIASGEISHDTIGVVGSGIEAACRLADAGALRAVLRAAPTAPVALAVSDEIYRTVVWHGFPDIDPDTYRPVEVTVKEFAARAWIRVPGLRVPPIPEEPPPPEADGAAPPGGITIGTVHNEGATTPLTGNSFRDITIGLPRGAEPGNG